jgi:hypothetical protein
MLTADKMASPPYAPSGMDANILAGAVKQIAAWIEGEEIPDLGPHTRQITQYGCTMNTDYDHAGTRSYLKKGMQGHLLEEKDTPDGRKANISIEGVTGAFLYGKWVQSLWVPAEIVTKGVPLKEDIQQWKTKVALSQKTTTTSAPIIPPMLIAAPDSSLLGMTVMKLLHAFYQSSSLPLGGRARSCFEERGIGAITRMILKGVRDANLYDTLNDPTFAITDILNASTHEIPENCPVGVGGIYLRHHVSSPDVSWWPKNSSFAYVGKAIDFRTRYKSHPYSTTKYGLLTLDSQSLRMVPLCILDDRDTRVLSNVVEQVFICLLETYRGDLLHVGVDSMDASNPLSVKIAQNYRNIAALVFRETRYPGAVNRSAFGVDHGANFDMPLAVTQRSDDQCLYIRHDTYVKDRDTGASMPMAVFRTAQPKTARYYSGAYKSSKNMIAFRSTYDISIAVTIGMSVFQGKDIGPDEGAPYHVVFEVRTDGGPHPHAWSRIPSIGPFQNWDQGRSLAVRVEWESSPGSGNLLFRYLQVGHPYKFETKDPGSSSTYAKTIALIHWLFDATPNHSHAWIPPPQRAANVIQVVYDIHTQSIEIRDPAPIAMVSGDLKDEREIIDAMRNVGLLNMDSSFATYTELPARSTGNKRSSCDACTMIVSSSTQVLKILGVSCIQVPGTNCCQLCLLFGRPRCSWTPIRATSAYEIQGTARLGQSGAATDDIKRREKIWEAIIWQHKWVDTGVGQNFKYGLLDAGDITNVEDDVSDTEEGNSELENDGEVSGMSSDGEDE